MLNKKQAEKRIQELRKQTEYYANKYYNEDKPEISDFEYDMLMLELRNLEKEYPEFISKESLTQHVGGKVKEGFKKVEHKIPLLSMQDIFSIEEIIDYVKKITSAIFSDFTRYCSIKLPTFSCSCFDILLYPYPGKSTK